jgi:hypothetical protein
MGIAEDMKRLTEDIRTANEMRLKAVGSLITQTRETLKAFHAGRGRMATNQAKDLAGFTGELCKNVETIRHKAQSLIREFEKANKQMSKEQSKRLTDFAQGLSQDVSAMLSRFDKEQGRMSKDLTRRLTAQIADIKAAVEQIIKGAGGFISEQHAGRIEAQEAWRDMSASMSKAGKVRAVPRARSRKRSGTTTASAKNARHAAKRTSHKTHGQKQAVSK